MYSKQYHTLKTTPTSSKKNLLQQNYYIHHPLLEQIISTKLEKCMKYGQVREKQQFLTIGQPHNKVKVIEAPCIMGNSKRL